MSAGKKYKKAPVNVDRSVRLRCESLRKKGTELHIFGADFCFLVRWRGLTSLFESEPGILSTLRNESNIVQFTPDDVVSVAAREQQRAGNNHQNMDNWESDTSRSSAFTTRSDSDISSTKGVTYACGSEVGGEIDVLSDGFEDGEMDVLSDGFGDELSDFCWISGPSPGPQTPIQDSVPAPTIPVTAPSISEPFAKLTKLETIPDFTLAPTSPITVDGTPLLSTFEQVSVPTIMEPSAKGTPLAQTTPTAVDLPSTLIQATVPILKLPARLKRKNTGDVPGTKRRKVAPKSWFD